MTYLYYQYCLSNFVIADKYRIEYFTKENENEISAMHHQNTFSSQKLRKSTNSNKLEGQIRRVYIPNDEITQYINGDRKFNTYDPLKDAPELYLEMNKIELFDEKSLMRFIRNYGIPFHLQSQKNETGLFSSVLFPKNEKEKFLLGMDVSMFYESLFEFQEVINLWNNILENNEQEMTKVKNYFEKDIEHYQKYSNEYIDNISLDGLALLVLNEMGIFYKGGELGEVLKEYEDNLEMILKLSKKGLESKSIWDTVKNTDLKEIATQYLNLKLRKIKSGETSTRFIGGKIVPAISLNNLLEVAGYQLKQAIFKNQKLKECVNCGALFEPGHGSRKFCPPILGKKRSTCENTYNQRKKRMRKKQERG